MKSFFTGRRCFSISTSCLLGSALAVGSASLLSGCGDDKGQMQQMEQKEDANVKAKSSMDFYKGEHLKGGAGQKK